MSALWAAFPAAARDQVLCGLGCRRPPVKQAKWVASGSRFCELCGREFLPRVWHQRFCSAVCGERVRDAVGRVKYRDQRRAVWRAQVATGKVRCARGAACRFAEGELGGFIQGRASSGTSATLTASRSEARSIGSAIVRRRSG